MHLAPRGACAPPRHTVARLLYSIAGAYSRRSVTDRALDDVERCEGGEAVHGNAAAQLLVLPHGSVRLPLRMRRVAQNDLNTVEQFVLDRLALSEVHISA